MENNENIKIPSWMREIKDSSKQKLKLDNDDGSETIKVIQLENSTSSINKNKIIEALTDLEKISNIDTESLNSIKIKGAGNNANKDLDIDKIINRDSNNVLLEEKFRVNPMKNEQATLDLVLAMTKYDGILDNTLLERDKYLEELEEKEEEKPEPVIEPVIEPIEEPVEMEEIELEEINIEPEKVEEPDLEIEEIQKEDKNLINKDKFKLEEDENIDLLNSDLSLEFSDEESKTYSLKELNDKYSISSNTQI